MKIKIAKFILASAFLFSFAYANKDKMPYPVELKTIDFIISSGIDIDFNAEKTEEKCSISYISGESGNDEADADKNKDKSIFNIKSDTLVRTMDKMQSITNKSLSGSHLEYVLIGEKTASDNLEYFAKNYSKSPKIRLDVAVFITKEMTSEDFFKKALTSDIDVNDRLNGIVNDREQLSYLTNKNLKDLLQIFYSEEKTGVIPVLEIIQSPDSSSGNDNEDDNEDDKESKNNVEKSKGNEKGDESGNDKADKEKSYTFGYYGLGIIKGGGLVGYLPMDLVRPYLIITKGVKNTILEVEDYDDNNSLSVFRIDNSRNKVSFKFDGNNLRKVIFDIDIETSYEETTSKKSMADSESLNNLNDMQTGIIKAEIEKIIARSKELNTDFLNIGETLGIQHPYKWQTIKDEWGSIFVNLEYEINISTKIKRHYNIAS